MKDYKNRLPKIWFYKIQGEDYVSTSKEIEIANRLSRSRGKVFLESRAYLRESLSYLFNESPLKIPVIANPNQPPILPKGMGFISLSHCKDAITIAWHINEIGIDIERSDREFNYKAIERKYFCKISDQQNNDFMKKEILNLWCGLEAAIKWNKGKLAEDICEWEYQKNLHNIYHKKKKISTQLSHISFLDWTIALAYKNKSSNDLPEIICSEIQQF